jgi:hypothetical protein
MVAGCKYSRSADLHGSLLAPGRGRVVVVEVRKAGAVLLLGRKHSLSPLLGLVTRDYW